MFQSVLTTFINWRRKFCYSFVFMFIGPTGLSLVCLNILLNFAQRGQKGLLALKQKNIKFDRHNERGQFSY